MQSIAGFSVHHFSQVENTQATLKELLVTSFVPSVVYADTQTAGRGRYDRQWQSLDGNIMMSFSEVRFAASQLAFLPYILAVALANTLALFNIKAQCKWPNDILISGKKCAGILVETQMRESMMVALVGIGLNVLHSPKETLYSATSLAEEGHETPSVDRFLQIFLPQYQALVAQFMSEGVGNILENWLSLCPHKGKMITVRQKEQVILGLCEAISHTGSLILRQENGTPHEILFGDVFLNG